MCFLFNTTFSSFGFDKEGKKKEIYSYVTCVYVSDGGLNNGTDIP